MKFAFSVLLLLSSALQGAPPCTFSVQGRITDQKSGEPLAFVSIQLIDSEIGVVSDLNGQFLLSDLCAGLYHLRVGHIGYKPIKVQVSVPNEDQLNLVLDQADYHLHEVMIEDSVNTRFSLIKLEVRDSELSSRTGMLLAEMAELIPGVRVLESGNTVAKPILRGFHSNRLVVLNDGIRQEGQNWGVEHSPEIDSYSADKMSIVEGPEALLYGCDGMAGMLLIEPKFLFDSDHLTGRLRSDLNSNGRGGSIGMDLRSRLSVKIPLYFAFQGSLKKLGWVKTPDDYLRNTGIEEANYSWDLGWKAENWTAKINYSNFNQSIGLYRYSHLGNLTDLAEVINGRPQPDTMGFSYDIERPRQAINHELFRSDFEINLPAKSKLKFTYAYQYNLRKEYDAHVGISSGSDSFSHPQMVYGLASNSGVVQYYRISSTLETSIGAQIISKNNSVAGRKFIPPYQSTDFALFAVQERKVKQWLLSYGLRYEWFDIDASESHIPAKSLANRKFSGLASSISAGKTIGQNTYQISLGTSWRPPAINELYANGLHHGAGVIEQGDSELNQERLWQIATALHRDFKRNHFLGTAYVHFVDGYIYAQPAGLDYSIQGAFPLLVIRQTDAVYWGADFQLDSKPFSGVKTVLRASFVWAENLNNGNYFIQIPAHQFDAGLRYTFDDWATLKRLYFGLDLRYTLQQYRAPNVFDYNSLFDPAPADLSDSFDFAPAPPDYFLVSLSAGFDIGNFRFSTEIENLLNTNYRNYLDLFRYYADEPGINFSFQLSYEF